MAEAKKEKKAEAKKEEPKKEKITMSSAFLEEAQKGAKDRDELAQKMYDRLSKEKDNKFTKEQVRRQLNNTIYAINKKSVCGKKWKDFEVVEVAEDKEKNIKPSIKLVK